MSHAAAITGVGAVSSAGIGAAAARAALRDGPIGRGLAPAPSTTELEPLLPGLGFPRPPRTNQLCLLAAREAWGQAALPESRDPERLALTINRNFGQHQVVARYLTKLWESGPGSVSGLQFVQTIANTALGLVAMQLTLRGPSELFFGPPSLGMALDWLRDNRADAVLAGGFDECSEFTQATCTAWGLDLTEFRASEGAAFALLEPPERAAERGQAILGYLQGYASLYDRIGYRRPLARHADDLAEVMRRALTDARLEPEAVELVIVNQGAGLPESDTAEDAALQALFPTVPPLRLPKAILGEAWGAAGGLSLLTALDALEEAAVVLVVDADFSGQDVAFVVTRSEEGE